MITLSLMASSFVTSLECDGIARHNCIECDTGTNSNKCSKCKNNYYVSSDGNCKRCYYNSVGFGSCLVCSDDNSKLIPGTCRCDPNYKEVNTRCLPMALNCYKDIYNNITDRFECLICNQYYALNKDKQCTSCGNECIDCIYNEETDDTTCLRCDSNILSPDNKCIKKIDNCLNDILDESSEYKNESLCKKCDIGFYPKNSGKFCGNCTADTRGSDCGVCRYNQNNDKTECFKCYKRSYLYSYDYYTFVQNTFQCLKNDDENKFDYFGCVDSIYNEETQRYECIRCLYYYIHIFNDKICKKKSEVDIYSDCSEVINLENLENPIYSCNKCKYSNNYTLTIIDSALGKKGCYKREKSLINCLEGIKVAENNYKCIKCVNNSRLNSSEICECNSDSFSKNGEWCYKCDDENEGNPGCLSEKGCKYNDNTKELFCNECKEGYVKYNNICISCKYKIPNCEKCHFNEINELQCDSCLGIFSLNSTNNNCTINECNEYPEIAPGCIICKDKLNEYKSNNKCQSCKYGYFMTKEGLCIYCRDEKYGGPGCYECGYEKDANGNDLNNIVCKNCFSIEKYYRYNDNIDYHTDKKSLDIKDKILTSDGKCYFPRYNITEQCFKYDLIKDANNNNKIVCVICPLGYFLDSDGNCYSYIDKLEQLPNCFKRTFNIGPFNFELLKNKYFLLVNCVDCVRERDFYTNFTRFNKYLLESDYPIRTICEECDEGYYINEKGQCEKAYVENCTGSFIIKDLERREKTCKRLCSKNDYPLIYLKNSEKNTEHFNYDFEGYENISMYKWRDIDVITRILKDDLFSTLENMNLKKYLAYHLNCYNYSEPELNEKFIGCESLLYIPKNNSYQCVDCKSGYTMNKTTKNCEKGYERIDIYACLYDNITNIGSIANPLYSCNKCRESYYTLVKYEHGAYDCVFYSESNDYFGLRNCLKAEADSYYHKPQYNCTACRSDDYGLQYSAFYGGIICQDKSKSLVTYYNGPNKFNKEKEILNKNSEGKCEKNYFLVGSYCYKCDSENVGMPGCAGECNFSLYRNRLILCEGECKEGYIETSKGVCEKCDSIITGCRYCHYIERDDNFYIKYKLIKKKRRVECIECFNGYVKSEDGKCYGCSHFGNCKNCGVDNITGKNVCFECKSDSGFDDSGKCIDCNNGIRTILNKKCIYCYDTEKGGIENCNLCKTNDEGNKFICTECMDNYILLNDEDNNNIRCLLRGKELKKFENCVELKYINNKYICTRCNHKFSLVKMEDNNYECLYIPNLYDPFFKLYYYEFYYLKIFNKNYDDFKKYYKNDYNYRQSNYYPCREAINVGSKENPIYSCIKCIDTFNYKTYNYYKLIEKSLYDEYDNQYGTDNYYRTVDSYYYNIPVKIIDITQNNISYCIKVSPDIPDMNYCLEAIYQIRNNQEIFKCLKCWDGYKNKYNSKTKKHYCSNNPFDVDDPDPEAIEKEKEKEKEKENEKEIEKKESDKKQDKEDKEEEIKEEENENEEIECNIKECKRCDINNPYLCLNCINSSYEINNITGSCVKKEEFIPSVTWKDIYNLNMNGNKEIKGQNINGISFKLRGITSSEINSGHAFTLFLKFTKKYEIGNLEQQQNMPAICEIENEVQKNNNKINIVDFECITYSTMDTGYKLSGIIDGDNGNNIKNADFNNINNIILTEGYSLTRGTNYKIQDLNKIIIFDINENDKIKYSDINHIFNFDLIGIINANIDLNLNTPYEVKVEINDITDELNCTFYLYENRYAKLTIYLELKNDKEKKKFTFGNSEIKLDNYFIYIPLLNELELNNNNENNLPGTDNKPEENDSSNNKTLVIVLSVVIGVLCLGGIGVGVFLIFIKKKVDKFIQLNPGNSSNDAHNLKERNNNEPPISAEPLSLNKN